MAGLKALDSDPRPHAFESLSRAYRFRDSGGATQYAIAFETAISNFAATPEETIHKHRVHASLLALVKNEQGEIVDRISKDVQSKVSDEHLAGVRARLMTYQRAVSLPPGRYMVETTIVDHEGDRASAGSIEIDNRPEQGVGLSDLMLIRQIGDLAAPPDAADPFQYTGKRVLPLVTTVLSAGVRPVVYLVVYPEPGNAAKPVLRVNLTKDGGPAGVQTPVVPTADVSGGIPMILELTTEPGTYEIRATVTQGDSSVERRLLYTVAGSRP